MDDGRYKGSGTPGGKWGCAIAVIIGLPLMVAGSTVAALGGSNLFEWIAWVASAAALAGLIGFGLRSMINILVRFFKVR